MKPGGFVSVLLIIASLLFPSTSFGDKIYRWVDEKGVVHFSDRQPDTPEKVKGSLEERELKGRSDAAPVKEPEIPPRAGNPIGYAASATFTIKSSAKTGTGFFISPSGYAVTCRHVIEGALNHKALLNDQSEIPITVIAVSYRYDLALLSILLPKEPPYLSLRPAETLAPGERVFAVGTSAGLQATITDGVFTGIRRIPETGQEVIQFSAPVNPGNSGGPLIDAEGKVLGVVNAKYLAKDGVPVSGVGFAVPSGHLKEEYGTYLR